MHNETIKHLNQIKYIIIYSTRINNLQLHHCTGINPNAQIEPTQQIWLSNKEEETGTNIPTTALQNRTLGSSNADTVTDQPGSSPGNSFD